MKNMDEEKNSTGKEMNSQPAAGGDALEALQKELEECRAKADEYLAGWQRARADFQNHKKDEMERLQNAIAFAGEDLMRELISVLDSFDLGIASLEKSGPVDRGIYMIRAQFEDALRKKGLVRLSLKPGDSCNHATMETMAETESDYPAGAVVSEVEAGYALNGRVLRPARVIVSKGKPDVKI